MELLQGTFSQHAHEEDILALLKRTNVVIFGRKAISFRPANPNSAAMKVLHYPDEKDNNLSDDVAERMSVYKKGRKAQAPIEDAAMGIGVHDQVLLPKGCHWVQIRGRMGRCSITSPSDQEGEADNP